MGRRVSVTDEELLAAFGVQGSFAGAARVFGVSREYVRCRLTSLGCVSEAQGISQRAVPPAERSCATCERAFFPYSDEARFCSPRCSGAGRRRHTDADLLELIKIHGNRYQAHLKTGVSMMTFHRRLGSEMSRRSLPLEPSEPE